jgi:hypothetical protein
MRLAVLAFFLAVDAKSPPESIRRQSQDADEIGDDYSPYRETCAPMLVC